MKNGDKESQVKNLDIPKDTVKVYEKVAKDRRMSTKALMEWVLIEKARVFQNKN